MSSLQISISLRKLEPVIDPPPEPAGMYARAPHDTEIVDYDRPDWTYIPNTANPNRVGPVRAVVLRNNVARPEVFRLLPIHSISLTEPLQVLWKKLNPELSGLKWRTLGGNALAWCNAGCGFGGDEPRIDYVNRRDLDARTPLCFDVPRYCGGHTFKVKRRESGRSYVETIRVDRPLPPIDELASELLQDPEYSPFWYWGTSINPLGRIGYVTRLGLSDTLVRVRIPLFTRQEAYIPSNYLHFLEPGETVAPNAIVHKL